MHSVAMTLGWDKVLAILFLVFSPLQVVGPFAALTMEAEPAFCRRLAWRATLFAGVGVLIAGVAGQRILMTWGIRQALLLLAGGIVWFLMALFMVLRPYLPALRPPPPVGGLSLDMALKPLAFPTIVTPYGTATLIVLMTTMQTIVQQGILLALVAGVLLLDWVAMIYARPIMRVLAVPLE